MPFSIFLAYSFLRVEDFAIVWRPNLGNYIRFFTDPLILAIFWKSILLSLQITSGCILLAFPIAYLIASLKGYGKAAVVAVIVIPVLLPYVMKIYSIRLILGSRGLLNEALIASGLIRQPVEFFVFNRNAFVLTMIILLIPYAVLPMALALERIPRNLVEAAADLGASALRIFRTVTLPLALPGIAGAASFVFILSFGDFLTPQMVGGRAGFTFGRMIYTQFGFAYNWPFGAALSVILVLTVLGVLLLSRAIVSKER